MLSRRRSGRWLSDGEISWASTARRVKLEASKEKLGLVSMKRRFG